MLVEEKEKKIKELQDNVSAVNFTASSKLGKMLMAKCRTLQSENEEIGEMASEGKVRSPLFFYASFFYYAEEHYVYLIMILADLRKVSCNIKRLQKIELANNLS